MKKKITLLFLILTLFSCCLLAGCQLSLTQSVWEKWWENVHIVESECLKGNHDYKKEIIAATCTEGEKAVCVCTRCGDRVEQVTSEPLGHDLEIVEVKEATCQSHGAELHSCKRCDFSETVQTDLAPHDYLAPLTVEPDCENDGYLEYRCRNCSESYRETTEELKSKGHNYVTVVTAPTCKEEGYSTYKCAKCSDTYVSDYVPALGHDYVSTVYKANIVYDGYTLNTCSRAGCNDSYRADFVVYNPNAQNFDTSVMDYRYHTGSSPDSYNTVSTMEQLQVVFDSAVINRLSMIMIYLKTGTGDFPANTTVANKDKIVATLVANCATDTNYSVKNSSISSFSSSYHRFSLNLSFGAEPSVTTSARQRFEKLIALNAYVSEESASRTFPIDSKKDEYTCTNTEQLWIAVEMGYKPVFAAECSARLVYESARLVLGRIVRNNMTDLEKAKAIYDWLVTSVYFDNVTYNYIVENINYAGTNDIYKYRGNYLEGVFLDGCATANGVAKAYVLLCGIEGIPCVRVYGEQTNASETLPWYWVKVKIGGKWYVSDASNGNSIYMNTYEYADYTSFLMTDREMAALYTPACYTKLSANTEFDYFTRFKFTWNGKQYDYAIASETELKDMVAYWQETSYEDTCLCLRVDYEISSGDLASVLADVKYIFANGVLVFYAPAE